LLPHWNSNRLRLLEECWLFTGRITWKTQTYYLPIVRR